jgi:hypothetical protein
MAITQTDLTTREGVVALMESSTDSASWNANCDAVKAANAKDGRPDYPSFWWATIIQSGLAGRVMAGWRAPSSPDIRISTIG